MSAEFDRLLARERRAEASRAAAHDREASRHRGVAWSGMGAEPFRRRSAGELNTAAEAAVAALKAWRASRAGRLNAALCRTQTLARAVHAAATAAQASLARETGSSPPLAELRAHATALLAAAAEAHAAGLD